MVINFALDCWQRSLQRLLPLLFLGSLIATLLFGNVTAIAQLPRPEIRSVWMTVNDKNILGDRTKVQDAMQQLRRLNFNTVYPVVWNSGYVMYESAVAKRNGIQPFVCRGFDGHDILADLTNQAHRQRLLAMRMPKPALTEQALAIWLRKKYVSDPAETSSIHSGCADAQTLPGNP